jgi:competence protein ComEA
MAHEPVDLVDDAVAPAEPRRPAPPPSFAELATRLASVARPRANALVAVAFLGVGAAVAGWALLREPELPPTEEVLPYAPGAEPGAAGAGDADPPSPTSTAPAAQLVVHAAGAVVVPGIHPLPPGSRVSDLLAAAGGPAPDADLDRVNLAALVGDGERVWFPRVGEEAEPPVVAGSGGGNGNGTGGDGGAPALVDLNLATAEELDTLPGVGPATAAAILEHRSTHGPFTSVEDLLDVPGIGEAKLEQLRDLVTV